MPPPQGHPNPIEGPGDYTTTREVHNDTYPAIAPRFSDLSGKSVLIVGASKGIGRAIAISYARAGASPLFLAARGDLGPTIEGVRTALKKDGVDSTTAGESKIIALSLDVTDEASVRAATERIGETTGGKLDVVVANAGVLEGMALIAESDPGLWWRNFEVNLRGPYLVARATLPLLTKGDLKVFVTVTSVGAHCVGPTGSGYQISKLAVLRLMQFVAAEYADQGIVAYGVHPGNTLTDIVNNGESLPPDFKAVFTETPQLCGDSLVYLTKESRAWLTGRYVNVTWDLPELLSDPKKAEIIKEDKLKVRLVV